MDIGTVLDGETAVKEGLINSLGGISQAIEKLYELIEKESNPKKIKKNQEDKESKEAVKKDSSSAAKKNSSSKKENSSKTKQKEKEES